jgi:hypothetical protein
MTLKTKDRIWIELDKPLNKEHALTICAKANRMMARLGDMSGNAFFWDEKDNAFCYGGDMGYMGLPDRGHWFNLDYLGREGK